MEQQLINRTYIALAQMQEALSIKVFKEAARLESHGGKDEFKSAQELKIAGNKLEAGFLGMKSKYPHLFKEIK